jgi:hypothetical protein
LAGGCCSRRRGSAEIASYITPGQEAAEGGDPLDEIDTGIYLMRPDGSDVRLLVSPMERGWNETWDWLASWPPRLA